MKVLIVVLLLALALPAQAHSTHDLDEWYEDWRTSVSEQGPVPELVAEVSDMMDRHPGYLPPGFRPVPKPTPKAKPSVNASMGNGSVEQWRPLVAKYFTNVDRALCLIRYESGGNPNARNPSGASGLFQVMPFWFSHFGGSAFDPENNTRVAAMVLAEQGWTAWAVVNRGKC